MNGRMLKAAQDIPEVAALLKPGIPRPVVLLTPGLAFFTDGSLRGDGSRRPRGLSGRQRRLARKAQRREGRI